MPLTEVAEALAVWLPGETALSNDLLKTLELRERFRERAREVTGESGEGEDLRRVREVTAERLDEAIRRGLRLRVGRWLGGRSIRGLALRLVGVEQQLEPDGPAAMRTTVAEDAVADHADKEAAACEMLMKLGGALPREIGVCGAPPDHPDLEADRGPGCGYIWERSNRKNLAVYCPDCTKRQEAPGVEWREDGSYLVRPIQPLRRLGFTAFGVQPCVVCGLRIDVKKLRDEAYCGPNCRQRAHRRRAAGVPVRDARDSAWIDMERTMAPDAHIRFGTCAGCGDDYSTVTDSDLCPRCVDVEAGHQEYLPRYPRTYDGVTGVPEGWNGITQPPDVAA